MDSKPTWTLGQITDNLTRGGAEWPALSVTYGFLSSNPNHRPESGGFSPFDEAQKEAASLACELWDDAIAIDLVASSNGNAADIRFGNTTSGPGHAWAYYPGATAAAGDVWINPASSSNHDLDAGEYGLMTLIHEVGHALGLSHPGDYDAGSGWPITYSVGARYMQDSQRYTTMSYFGAREAGADHVDDSGARGYASAPLLHDIAAIQEIYGADMQTRSGNTVYGFNATAGREVFDLAENQHPVFAIWDGGGLDMLNLSGYSTDSIINLNPGSFSSCDGMTKNLAIAYGCTIENAIGGAGNDRIVGNAADNRLFGGLGTDQLTGKQGSDRFDFNSVAESGKGAARDVITDFLRGVDKIDLTTIDADIDGTSGDQAFRWLGDDGFSGVDGQLRYVATSSGCKVQGDVNGDAVADLEVQVLGVSTMQSSDFLL